MKNVGIELTGSRVTLDFSRSGLIMATMLDRVQEVLPLLHALLVADDVWLKLSDDDQAKHVRGCLAINMMCQGATQNATKYAELLRAIADGSQNISDHGFPEFEGRQSLDV